MSSTVKATAEGARQDARPPGGTFCAAGADETALAAQVSDLMWPNLTGPQDLAAVEAVPLDARGLPVSTYAMLQRAASLWPEQPAVTVLPSAERFRECRTCDCARLLTDVRRTANAFTAAGVTRRGTIGLLSQNNAELLAATLGAQAAGIAVPVNPGLSSEHVVGILQRAAVTVLVAAGPEVHPALWGTARQVASRLGATALFALRPTGATAPAPVLEPPDGIDVAYLSERAQALPDDGLLAPPPATADLAVATLSGVPTVYSALAQVPVDADMSSLQFATVGASPLPSAVREAFQARSGVELAEGYRLTEATCASARQFPGQLRSGSVGQRLPYQRVRTVGPGGPGSRADLVSGEPGLLVLEGPNVFAGYVTGHDADGPVLDHLGTVHDGWLDTGDRLRIR